MKKKLITILILCLFVTTCSTTNVKKNVGIALKVSKDTLIEVARSVKKAHFEGTVSRQDYKASIAMYNSGRGLLVKAKGRWDTMIATDNFTDYDQYDILIIEVTEIIAEIRKILDKRKEGKQP